MPIIKTGFYVNNIRSCDELRCGDVRHVEVSAESPDGYEVVFRTRCENSPIPGDILAVTVKWGEDK